MGDTHQILKVSPEILKTMYRVDLTDPKSKNRFVKTVALSRAQEDILKAVSPRLLVKCSV
jgi:hypothetical protein